MPNFSVRLFDETNLKRSRLLRRSPTETPRHKLALKSIFTLETAPQSRLTPVDSKNIQSLVLISDCNGDVINALRRRPTQPLLD